MRMDSSEAGNRVTGETRMLLRVEGAALFLGASVAYFWFGYGWGIYVLLLLVPDLSVLGYLRGNRVGARVYNAFHITPWPLLVTAIGLYSGTVFLVQLGLCWAAHIGADRAFGYGLKNPESFQSTHLGMIGLSRISRKV